MAVLKKLTLADEKLRKRIKLYNCDSTNTSGENGTYRASSFGGERWRRARKREEAL